MSSRPALTVTEHKHCLVLAVLMGLIFTWRAFMLEPEMIAETLDTLSTWLSQQRQELVSSRKVDVSLANVAKGVWATTWIGLPLLFMQYLGHTLRAGRWLAPATLWAWTAIYGLFPVLAAINLLHLILSLPTSVAFDSPRLVIFYSGEILLGVLITAFAFRAWWQHRREEKAARAAADAPA